MLSGIDSLIGHVLGSNHCSDYHISGWLRVTDELRCFILVTAIASYIPDAFLGCAFEDDRVVQQLAYMQAAVSEEIEYVSTLPDPVWGVLSALAHCSPRFLQSITTRAAHVAAGFLDTRAFSAARMPPWHLCHGNREDNLQRLSEVVEIPSEATTSKLWRLLRLGYNRAQLLDALELMSCVSWSVKVTEQGHVHASSLNKLHEHRAETLVCRAMLCSMRSLFAASPQELLLQRLVHKLESQLRYNTNRISGRQAYLKDFSDVARDMKKRGRQVGANAHQKVFMSHASMWSRQSYRLKQRYGHVAFKLQEERGQAHEQEVQHLRDRIVLEKQRQATEAYPNSDGPRQVACVRFGPMQVVAFDSLYIDDFVSHKKVALLRQASREPPTPPCAAMQEAIHACADPPREVDVPRPHWWAAACRARSELSDSVWRFSPVEGPAVFLKFLYATISPLMVCYQRLHPKESSTVSLADCMDANWEGLLLNCWQHRFRVTSLDCVRLSDMGSFVDAPIDVLLGCVHLGDEVVSDAGWVALGGVLALSPEVSCAAAVRSGRRAKPDLVAENPWLQNFLSEQDGVSKKKAKPNPPGPSQPPHAPGEEPTSDESSSEGLDEECALDLLYRNGPS